MTEACGRNALLDFGGGWIRLLGMFGEGRNAVARELELILEGENVGGANVSMDETFAVEEGESLQRGS